ncbi:MAG: PspC domain-containing protein [Armatimonadota bacterium]|nr:PspC domain-containing protein [Armatimonadota bacterium]MDR7452202.1 PspC domain-containing protein [Armatimonadota bacterium]MDR7468031.1 PspC domain-containing protein [Armatimonadota bacterium]MDR7494928.1 PspC domain-containing protein [Armatimonadota bacterium]MDR7500378.1 PspC domain-containing protein [Armatimonadota bacterium]
MARRLMRSRKSRMIAGVCGGIAEYLDADPTIVRLLWALITLFPGTLPVGLLGYIVAWIIMPEEPATA